MLRVKSQGLLIGWKCPKCPSENTVNATRCQECHYVKAYPIHGDSKVTEVCGGLIGWKCQQCTFQNPSNVQSCKQCHFFNRIEVIGVYQEVKTNENNNRWSCFDCNIWLPDEDSLRKHKSGNVHQGYRQLKQLEKEAKILSEREYFVNRALPSYDYTKSGMAYKNLQNPFEVRSGLENVTVSPSLHPDINYQSFGNTTGMSYKQFPIPFTESCEFNDQYVYRKQESIHSQIESCKGRKRGFIAERCDEFDKENLPIRQMPRFCHDINYQRHDHSRFDRFDHIREESIHSQIESCRGLKRGFIAERCDDFDKENVPMRQMPRICPDISYQRCDQRRFDRFDDIRGNVLKCEMCDVYSYSDKDFKQHLSGSRHKEKKKDINRLKYGRDLRNSYAKTWLARHDPNVTSVKMEYAKKWKCKPCNVSIRANQIVDIQAHLSGRKHKENTGQTWKSEPANISTEANQIDLRVCLSGRRHEKQIKEEREYSCDLCCVKFSSTETLQNHYQEMSHIKRAKVEEEAKKKTKYLNCGIFEMRQRCQELETQNANLQREKATLSKFKMNCMRDLVVRPTTYMMSKKENSTTLT